MKSYINHSIKYHYLSMLNPKALRTQTQRYMSENVFTVFCVKLKPADVYLQCCLSFSLNVFQFFTKPKPPKGYYIYGDVGKRLVV